MADLLDFLNDMNGCASEALDLLEANRPDRSDSHVAAWLTRQPDSPITQRDPFRCLMIYQSYPSFLREHTDAPMKAPASWRQ